MELGDFFEAAQDGGVFGLIDFLAAGVVGAALHVADLEGLAEGFFEERDIAEEELFLEGLGVGGDDDASAGEDGRNQVGESLAGSCAGFDDQFALFREGGVDGFGHFQLAGAQFEGGMGGGKGATGAEETAQGAGSGTGSG